MGYVEQPAASYVQDATGAVVNGMGGVMPVVGGMPNAVNAAPAAPPVAVMSGITRVYVGNLSWETEWQDLKDHMRTAGEVRARVLMRVGRPGALAEWRENLASFLSRRRCRPP